jgi:hypothetical protein
MSYDLIVFAPSHVPTGKKEFLSWYDSISGTANDFRFPDSTDSVPQLQGYFDELKSYLPWHEEQPDAEGATDYSFARYMIHCAFPWSSQRKALDTVLALCWRLKLGLYDISGSNDVLFPEDVWDIIRRRSQERRPWWKFWKP